MMLHEYRLKKEKYKQYKENDQPKKRLMYKSINSRHNKYDVYFCKKPYLSNVGETNAVFFISTKTRKTLTSEDMDHLS